MAGIAALNPPYACCSSVNLDFLIVRLLMADSPFN
jgi:hypothetical protein